MYCPAFNVVAAGLAAFAGQPADAVVRAACRIPLWAQVGQAGLHGVGEGQHQCPARCHRDAADGFQQGLSRTFVQTRCLEQIGRLEVGQGQYHAVKAVQYFLGAFGGFVVGVQFPATGVNGVAGQARHAGVEVHGGTLGRGQRVLGIGQRLGPGAHQCVHAGCGHVVGFAGGWVAGQHMAQGVEHAHGAGAPGHHHIGRGGEGFDEAIVACREVLGTVVKTTELGVACGHAATKALAFFHQCDLAACLGQRAGTGHTGHASANDGHAQGLGGGLGSGLLCGGFAWGRAGLCGSGGCCFGLLGGDRLGCRGFG